ncbi:four-helix bundle copper-binding protein [Acinetobacter radioresistens]|nr:four-helix bundle copper-binding protein [Acinetobacter radioresistens]
MPLGGHFYTAANSAHEDQHCQHCAKACEQCAEICRASEMPID